MRNPSCWSLVVAVATGVAWAPLAAQPPAAGPVFTAEQVDVGLAAYRAHCASCHAGDLGGRTEAPALAGVDFVGGWRAKTTRDLFQYVQAMPPEGERLSADDYLGVVAYILQQNGATAGQQTLTFRTEVLIGAIATGQRPAARPSGRGRGHQ